MRLARLWSADFNTAGHIREYVGRVFMQANNEYGIWCEVALTSGVRVAVQSFVQPCMDTAIAIESSWVKQKIKHSLLPLTERCMEL